MYENWFQLPWVKFSHLSSLIQKESKVRRAEVTTSRLAQNIFHNIFIIAQ